MNGNQVAQRQINIPELILVCGGTEKPVCRICQNWIELVKEGKTFWPELEKDLLTWAEEKCYSGLAILLGLVRMKALAKTDKHDIPDGQLTLETTGANGLWKAQTFDPSDDNTDLPIVVKIVEPQIKITLPRKNCTQQTSKLCSILILLHVNKILYCT